MPTRRGTLDGSRLRIALVVSRYNGSVTDGLRDGALAELAGLGVPPEHVVLVEVPGALEIPVVAQRLLGGAPGAAAADAVVALGCVIRGETDHYQHVAAECARGCGEVALRTGRPVAFGVLTCETLAQARERSGAGPKNKGREAARAAVETANLLAGAVDAPRPAAGRP